MKYEEFEDAFSSDRMSKYVTACNGDTRRSMMLYRCNLRLSQEMFTLISCFEVTLFQWMGIDSGALLYGLDHVGQSSNKIMSI